LPAHFASHRFDGHALTNGLADAASDIDTACSDTDTVGAADSDCPNAHSYGNVDTCTH
jgi:hypothetical protein